MKTVYFLVLVVHQIFLSSLDWPYGLDWPFGLGGLRALLEL